MENKFPFAVYNKLESKCESAYSASDNQLKEKGG